MLIARRQMLSSRSRINSFKTRQKMKTKNKNVTNHKAKININQTKNENISRIKITKQNLSMKTFSFKW